MVCCVTSSTVFATTAAIVRLLRHPVQFQLSRLVLFLDRLDDGGLDIRLLQVSMVGNVCGWFSSLRMTS
jgi:hypothetical protein